VRVDGRQTAASANGPRRLQRRPESAICRSSSWPDACDKPHTEGRPTAHRLPDLGLERRPIAASERPDRAGSPRGAGDERGHDVRGVAIQGLAPAVVAHGGTRVSVTGGFLDVTQRNSGVEPSGDERVPQSVRPDAFGDAGLSGDATRQNRRSGRSRQFVRCVCAAWVGDRVFRDPPVVLDEVRDVPTCATPLFSGQVRNAGVFASRLPDPADRSAAQPQAEGRSSSGCGECFLAERVVPPPHAPSAAGLCRRRFAGHPPRRLSVPPASRRRKPRTSLGSVNYELVVFAFGWDEWTTPAGPVPNARSTFSVTAVTIGLNGDPGPGGVSFVIHQIDPEANTPAPLGAE
jgi:hypothetical protein